MAKLEENLQITDLSRSGPGVARDEAGRVVFVPLTAPGDIVNAEIESEEKRYAQGRLVQLVQPSGQRQTPPCAVFGRCGGCQWQHLSYELQWKTKRGGVEHALSRVQVKIDRSIEELPAERVWEYRNRVQLRGEHRPDGTALGFYAPGTHDVIAIERCEIARPEINQALSQVREESRKFSKPFKVELEVDEDGTLHTSWNRGHAALGFRQVHDEQNEKLRAWVGSVLTPGRPLLDLFGGSGNLSRQFAETSPEIHCVDFSVPRERPAGLPESYRYHRASVAEWLDRFAGSLEGAQKPWSVILDPPREGLGEDGSKILSALGRLGVREFVLVGCDADSWARDVSRAVRKGWRLERVAVLDLFPQTPHVESLALLVLR